MIGFDFQPTRAMICWSTKAHFQVVFVEPGLPSSEETVNFYEQTFSDQENCLCQPRLLFLYCCLAEITTSGFVERCRSTESINFLIFPTKIRKK